LQASNIADTAFAALLSDHDDIRQRQPSLPIKTSLFFKIFSLLICVGNLPRSDCGTGAFRTEIASRSPKIAKFPVNFPDSRELQVETGSYLAAHTTTHSRNFALSETSREKAVFAGVV
jgi:hypothetical protein